MAAQQATSCEEVTPCPWLHERINASGLEGVNRPAKQFQPISAKYYQTLEPLGFSLKPPEKCTEVYFPRGFVKWMFFRFTTD
jgi:hypothetical protein